MKAFVNFLINSKRLKTNFILALIIACLIPAKNYYNSLTINQPKPLVRPINQSVYSISKYPLNYTNKPAPYLSAQSAIVVDIDSKAILYTKNPDQKLLPASITKIMTALIALENYNLDDLVTVKSLEGVEGQTMELELNEKITVENLLYGLLVQSGNDAAIALAQFHPDGQKAFVKAMNDKLLELNLYDTQFQNPTGLDEYGHYTTVHDLSLIAGYAMENDIFAKMVNTQNITVFNHDQTITHELETINQLLGQVSGLKGVKTGWTELAGECLVTYTKRDSHRIITVVLGSLDRFDESSSLIDWAFTNHQWTEVQSNTR